MPGTDGKLVLKIPPGVGGAGVDEGVTWLWKGGGCPGLGFLGIPLPNRLNVGGLVYFVDGPDGVVPKWPAIPGVEGVAGGVEVTICGLVTGVGDWGFPNKLKLGGFGG